MNRSLSFWGTASGRNCYDLHCLWASRKTKIIVSNTYSLYNKKGYIISIVLGCSSIFSWNSNHYNLGTAAMIGMLFLKKTHFFDRQSTIKCVIHFIGLSFFPVLLLFSKIQCLRGWIRILSMAWHITPAVDP